MFGRMLKIPERVGKNKKINKKNMPTLSYYLFDNPDFTGNTFCQSTEYPEGGWAWQNDMGIQPAKQSVLAWEREDSEITFDLVSVLNNPTVLSLIDSSLGGSANRTSGIMAGWIPWKNVPYYTPGTSRGDYTLLIRLAFNFEIDTPWYCDNANGTIEYMIVTFLDGNGNLNASVDGWAYNYGGGLPFCRGSINSGLDSAVPAAIPTLQTQLNTLITLLNASGPFGLVYYLPGDGSRSANNTVDVDNSISLALLPLSN